jgi:hypothetical protein
VSVVSGTNGSAILTLTGDEMVASIAQLAAKGTGPKTSLIPDIRPQVLGILFSGTATAGAAGSITLATDVPPIAKLLIGCIVKTTGGTGGGGGTGSLNNQARVITAYSTGRVATVVPNWEVTPDATTTYEILVTERALFRAADLALILGDDATTTRLERALNTESLVVIGSASTVTNIVISSIIPTFATADQFNGKMLHFPRATTTTNLRGQSTRILDGDSGLQSFTVTALTTAPVSGDVAIIT